MKRYLPVLIAAVCIVASIVYGMTREYPNPDPNHTHADFAVWVNGEQLDFSDQRYMSEAYDPNNGQEIRVNPLRKYLHLHDGNGHVVHRHKPGLTLGEFMASIGNPMEDGCITLDEQQFGTFDAGWKESLGIQSRLCDAGTFSWKMIVNGTVGTLDPSYVFNDEDQILLSYDANDSAYLDEWKKMTDDACRYSQTCPWRGAPPTENCIADPTVPCVVPEN